MKFDENKILEVLKRCWSKESSTIWTEENPARGQCGVTALVIHSHYGGTIMKTKVNDQWHFYNCIDNNRFDFTSGQFSQMPEYEDIISDTDEAFDDTNEAQYSYLLNKYKQEINNI